jgi:hypothetical protein
MNGKSVDAGGKLVSQHFVDHPVTFKAALSAKRFRHDIDADMGFAAGPMSGMAFVLMGFVLHVKALGRENLAQLFGDKLALMHRCSYNPGESTSETWTRRRGRLQSGTRLHQYSTERRFATSQALNMPCKDPHNRRDEIKLAPV